MRVFAVVAVACALAACSRRVSDCGPVREAQPKWKELFEAQQPFQLRDAIGSQRAPCLYRAYLADAFNDLSAAEDYARMALAIDPESATQSRLGLFLFHNEMGQYKQAHADATALKYRWHFNLDGSGVAFTSAAAGLKQRVVSSRRPSKLTWKRHAAAMAIPVTVQHQQVWYYFDTGTPLSLLSEAEAKRLGIRVYEAPGFRMDGLQGSAPARVGLIDDLSIGGFEVHNVAVGVVPTDPGGNAENGLGGLIGMNLMREVGTIRWTKSGSFEIGFPSATTAAGAPANLCFDELEHLIADARLTDRPVLMMLDTGAERMVFLPQFARLLPSGAPRVRSSAVTLGDSGKSETLRATVLPRLTLTIGDRETTVLDGVLLSQGSFSLPKYDVLVGLDFLGGLSEVSLDLHAMRLKIQ
jgi:predicted aspartyl protease